MTLRENLKSQLVRFDDEAFTTLANKGLLRRAYKDLEALESCAVTETNDAIIVVVGAQQVTFDARGPAGASCNCPASGVCQHILSAAIWLQRSTETTTAAETPYETAPVVYESDAETGSADPESYSDSHKKLLSFGFSSLLKHGGKPAYRWAWQFVQDLDHESSLRVSGDKYLVLSFEHPRITFRFMGNDLDSLIADSQTSHTAKYRVAAVLAYQLANGIAIQPPEAGDKLRTAALSLGKDHDLADSMDDAKSGSRKRLRTSVKQLLTECIELGLSHLSIGIHERYSTLAVWAQGAEYHRLALLLRRLADYVELLLERDGNADEHRLFDEMTLAYGLLTALENADKKNLSPAYLVGRAKNQYDAVTQLDLIGLGASPWRAASGYVGLTMLFWSIADRRFLSCTDARPESQRGFNPVARYKAPGPWSGLGSPAQASGNRVQLSSAQLNALGRISTSENSHATVKAITTAKELLSHLDICSQWSQLYQARANARQSLLAEPQPMRDWVALKPERYAETRFDQARQTLIWPLFDRDGQVIHVELPYSEFNSHAIDRIEKLDMPALSKNGVLIARVRATAEGLVADPMSLIGHETNSSANPLDALFFNAAPASNLVAKAMSRFRRMTEHRDNDNAKSDIFFSQPFMLEEFRTWTKRQVERGISSMANARVADELEEHFQRLRTSGFTGFSQQKKNKLPAAESILQSHYIGMQYMRLLDNRPEETEMSIA